MAVKSNCLLYQADSLTFDWSKLPKINYIFTSPPFFTYPKSIFGDNPTQHVQRMITFFRTVLEKTKARFAIVHINEALFGKITKNNVYPLEFSHQLIKGEGKFELIDESSLYAIFSRHFPKSRGKTLLDPFAGIGSTLRVARSFEMNVIGIDNDPEQLAIASKNLNCPIDNLTA